MPSTINPYPIRNMKCLAICTRAAPNAMNVSAAAIPQPSVTAIVSVPEAPVLNADTTLRAVIPIRLMRLSPAIRITTPTMNSSIPPIQSIRRYARIAARCCYTRMIPSASTSMRRIPSTAPENAPSAAMNAPTTRGTTTSASIAAMSARTPIRTRQPIRS